MSERADRFLITGATGFVGANIARRLVELGERVTALTRPTSDRWRINDIADRIEFVTADLGDAAALRAVIERIKPTVIFHLATSSVYGSEHAAESDIIRINFIGTVNLIRVCDDVPYRCFVNTGSSSEYGPKTEPMRETDRTEPRDMYGITKCAATHYASAVGMREAKPILTFRLFSPFGPYDDPRRFLPTMINAALRGKDLQLADPAIGRDFVYIGDIVDAYLAAVERASKLRGEIFNIGSGRETALGEAVETILELTGSASQPRWHTFPTSPQDNPRWQADISKAGEILDWRPRTDFRTGVQQTIAWMRDHLERYGPTHHG